MEIKEAIDILTRIQEPEAWEPQITKEAWQALEMAKEALVKESQGLAKDSVKDLPDTKVGNCSEIPNSSDLIGRRAAIDALSTPHGILYPIRTIENMPPAQPERKRGKWINAYPDIEPNPMFMYGICSVCGYEQAISDKLKFCPNCGADMRGGQDEVD